VETTAGDCFTSRVEVPKGDPGNTLSRAEIEDKAGRLAAFQRGATAEELRGIVDRAWNLHKVSDLRDLLPRV
jgi:2-methylcitrate dehydratase PrpD